MANYIATDTELTSVADAIRTKGGTEDALEFPDGFVSAIQNIPSGGGGITGIEFDYIPTSDKSTDSAIYISEPIEEVKNHRADSSFRILFYDNTSRYQTSGYYFNCAYASNNLYGNSTYGIAWMGMSSKYNQQSNLSGTVSYVEFGGAITTTSSGRVLFHTDSGCILQANRTYHCIVMW